MGIRRVGLILSLVLLGAGLVSRAAEPDPKPSKVEKQPAGTVAPALVERDRAVQMGRVEVRPHDDEEEFDSTGMGTYEQQLRDWPFANDLVATEPVEDPVVDAELAQITSPSAVDLATGESRLSLRGFPTPLLRNGFVSMGATDMLNTSRTVVIQGALVPVLGRAAPGGIQDFWTARPRARPGQLYQASLSSKHQRTAAAEIYGTTVKKKAWHRAAFNWSRRTGPERFTANSTHTGSAALSWRHGPRASTLWAIDWQELRANLAPGIPQYRNTTGAKIVGPYLPLAGFNVYGPDAGIRRRTGAATVWLDSQPTPRLTLRAGLEAWYRTVEQDRFTTGLYNVTTKRFEGTREPRHTEQPQEVILAHLEATKRFSFRGTEHKLMAAVSHTWGTYTREERALSIAARNALPADVRLFYPSAPNYSRTPFSPETYSRVLADRQERAQYTAIELTERMGVAGGKVVLATGLRQDIVGLKVSDRRPGNPMPRVSDEVGQLTYHCGVNYQAVPSRLLVFATMSTAFDPSTRVDARTGRIQGNDTTRGYEGGIKARSPDGDLVLSASGFLLLNQDISRRNPLYDDPIYDANQTQPQLVAAGEERFSGGKIEGRWKPSPPWTFSARAAYTRAITTASPDLPQEVGRPLTRLPPYNASASGSYVFDRNGKLKGLSASASWSYVSRYVAQYEDRQRYELSYPGYGLLSASLNYAFRRKVVSHNIAFAVRNVGNYDLLGHQDRVGGEREYVGSYRMMF